MACQGRSDRTGVGCAKHHCWSGNRLCNCVGLAAFDIRLHVAGWHQLHFMPLLGKFPSPIIRYATRLRANQTLRRFIASPPPSAEKTASTLDPPSRSGALTSNKEPSSLQNWRSSHHTKATQFKINKSRPIGIFSYEFKFIKCV